jgi:hypothetical protein
MSINHKAQVQRAKADFVKKLTTWISETPKHEASKSLTEAALLQRILDIHAFREATTEHTNSPSINKDLIPRIYEDQFMKLFIISRRDKYVETLFGFFWSKKGLGGIKAQTRALVQLWLDFPKERTTFPYTRGLYSNPHQGLPKSGPKWDIPDAWDDDAWDDDAWDDEPKPKVKPSPVKGPPHAEEFAALAKELGVPFQKGDNVGAAYKKLALLMHPDKHPTEEAEVWTAKMKRLNALRDELLK